MNNVEAYRTCGELYGRISHLIGSFNGRLTLRIVEDLINFEWRVNIKGKMTSVYHRLTVKDLLSERSLRDIASSIVREWKAQIEELLDAKLLLPGVHL